MKTLLKKNELLTLNINDIKISNNNPRKIFNEKELEELSSSIKLKGVLQPILVRVINNSYELVCGERRLRASILAEIKTIPSFVRELTDDEAFECMIIENLERKDVHPMEEAEAFEKMIKSEKYSIPDIAFKLNKSEQMIIQRLKLNSLINELKEDFFNNVFSISHAILMARQSEENQLLIFNNFKDSYNADYNGYGTCKNLNKYIDGFMVKLASAIFDKEKNDSENGCIACTLCSKRTGANQLLFSDLDNEDKCLDRICFEQKTNNHLIETIKSLILNEENLYFVDYGYQVAGFIVELFTQYDIKILKEGTDYQSYKQSNNQKISTGIRVDKSGNLQRIEIYLKGAIASLDSSLNSESNPNALQIEKIKSRAFRNLELDQEKNTKNISESFRSHLTNNEVGNFNFSSDFMESVFLYFALSNVGLYQIDGWLDELKIENKFNKAETFEQLQESLLLFSSEDKKKLLAKMIYNNFKHDFPKNIGAKIIRSAFEFNKNNNIKDVEIAQQILADKRISRERERINVLIPRTNETMPVIKEIPINLPKSEFKKSKK